jgi:ATP-dependent Clp protease protease subunit
MVENRPYDLWPLGLERAVVQSGWCRRKDNVVRDGTIQEAGSETWPGPPEVPPRQPPGRPSEPVRPGQPAPGRILPTWEETAPSSTGDGELVDRLLDERVILVNGRLDDALAERTSQMLLLLGRRDHSRPIELYLSCPGSELAAALSVAAATDLAGAPVHATVTGTLSGPGVAVLCAAAERTAHRHATVVLSVPRASDTEGALTPIATRAEEHALMVAQVIERVAAVTGRPTDQVGEDLRSGRILSAREAQDYGLVGDVR